jgi:hypothetical protein
MSLVGFICTKQQSIIMMADLFSSKMITMIALDFATHLRKFILLRIYSSKMFLVSQYFSHALILHEKHIYILHVQGW